MKKEIQDLKNLVELQSTKGNYDQSDYMRGLANGLIMALAIFEHKEPNFFEPLNQNALHTKKLIEVLERLRKSMKLNPNHYWTIKESNQVHSHNEFVDSKIDKARKSLG